MPRLQKSKKPKISRRDFSSNLHRMFSLFAGQRKVLVFTVVMSIVEAVMITFTTFCICVIYSNFFTNPDQQASETFLFEN
ncbi:MAG: hypothetical protein MJ201_00880 [Mycoplasmoidaceae bacterium]|nr:hypothetical protein [Mycoplasmoidaceae bacterium]